MTELGVLTFVEPVKLMQNVLILSDSHVVHTKGRRSAHVWIPGWPELPARVSQHPVPWCALTRLLPLKLDRSIGPWPISRVQQYCHDASGRWGNANTNSGSLSTCAFQAGHSSEPSKSLNFTLLDFFIYLASNKCFVPAIQLWSNTTLTKTCVPNMGTLPDILTFQSAQESPHPDNNSNESRTLSSQVSEIE